MLLMLIRYKTKGVTRLIDVQRPFLFEENLEKKIKEVSEKYYDYIDMIVLGGLRWIEKIEFDSFEYAQKQQIRKTIALLYSERKENYESQTVKKR